MTKWPTIDDFAEFMESLEDCLQQGCYDFTHRELEAGYALLIAWKAGTVRIEEPAS